MFKCNSHIATCLVCTCSATINVGDRFAREAQTRGTLARLMSLLASPSNMNPSSRGHFFEVLKHGVMCSGGRMEYRCVVGGFLC